jgi:RsiW-degrading membrane proteinase PrsW (M82 family)
MADPAPPDPKQWLDSRAAGSLDLQSLRREFASVNFKNLVPIHLWVQDRPWDLVWVRLFLFFAIFPLAFGLYYGSRGQEIDLRLAAWAFSIYFALMWALVLRFCLQPEAIGTKTHLKVTAFTAFLGVLAVLVLSRLPIISSLTAETQSASLAGRLLGFTLGVGLVEEGVKAFPIYLFLFRKGQFQRPLTYAYMGAMSGLAFGSTEAVVYSLSYAQGLAVGGLGFGDYIVVQFIRFITLPLLHGIWSGMACYFVGLAALNRNKARVLFVVGLSMVAVLHGVYDTFASGWGGLAIAVVSLLMFVSYARTDAHVVSEVQRPILTESMIAAGVPAVVPPPAASQLATGQPSPSQPASEAPPHQS